MRRQLADLRLREMCLCMRRGVERPPPPQSGSCSKPREYVKGHLARLDQAVAHLEFVHARCTVKQIREHCGAPQRAIDSQTSPRDGPVDVCPSAVRPASTKTEKRPCRINRKRRSGCMDDPVFGSHTEPRYTTRPRVLCNIWREIQSNVRLARLRAVLAFF